MKKSIKNLGIKAVKNITTLKGGEDSNGVGTRNVATTNTTKPALL